jgi:hypothetical protein
MTPFYRKLDCHFTLAKIDDQINFSVLIRKPALSDFIAVLWMIFEDLGDALILGTNCVKCRLQAANEATHVNEAANPLQIMLGKREIATLAAFLLRYYRDQFAPVDHIDFDVPFQGGQGYLTFKVEESAAAVSETEARQRLGV